MYLITKEQYLRNLQNRFPTDDIEVLDPFISASSPVSVKCKKCGQIFHYKTGTTLYNKKRKHFCPLCNSQSVIKMVQACLQMDISITYGTNVIEPWHLHCNKCNTDFYRAPSTWQQYSCPNCGHSHNLVSKEQRQKQLDEYFGQGEFEILDEIPTNDHITVKHKCGFIRKTQFSALLRSKGCPRCNNTMSYGEKRISLYLDTHHIPYISQAKMGNTKQSFDFLIGNIAIEFNGKQHYEPVEIFGGEKRFQEQQTYDTIKKQYCEQNNIKLITIPYTDINNINTILDNLFRKFNDQSQDVKKD